MVALVNRKERMDRLRDLQRLKENQAAQNLKVVGEQRRRSEQQLSQLNEYQQEYDERLRKTLSDGVSPSELANLRGFSRRLDQAITLQGSEVNRSGASWEGAAQRWRQSKQKTQTLDAISQTLGRQCRRREERREQESAEDQGKSEGNLPKS